MLPNNVDTLALVGLYWMVMANRCGGLSNQLLVDARDLQLRSAVSHHNRDTVWNVVVDVVRETKLQLQDLAIKRRVVANAADFNALREAVARPML